MSQAGSEVDQQQLVRVRALLHAANECHSYDTDRDVARVLARLDALHAENERLRARIEELEGWIEVNH